MIDWITAYLPCKHVPIRAGSVFSVDSDGNFEWETLKRMSVEGSFSNKITVRSFGSAGPGLASELEISGNPSKFLQGHNVFGSDDLQALVFKTFINVCDLLGIIPFIDDIQKVKQGEYRLSRVDINYSFVLPCQSDVKAWLRASELKSKTRHGRPSSKGGTVYWGKSSKRWSIKAYSKAEEIKKHKLPLELLKTPITDWAEDKLRIELTLRKRELEDLFLLKAKSWHGSTPRNLFNKYIERIDMAEQIRLTDKQLLELPQKLRSTYILWRDGHDLRDTLPKATYYRHRKTLMDSHGINIDLAECKTKKASNVVSLIRVLEAKPAEVPSWAFEQGLVYQSAVRG